MWGLWLVVPRFNQGFGLLGLRSSMLNPISPVHGKVEKNKETYHLEFRVSQSQVCLFWVPIIRIIVFGVLRWGSHIVRPFNGCSTAGGTRVPPCQKLSHLRDQFGYRSPIYVCICV